MEPGSLATQPGFKSRLGLQLVRGFRRVWNPLAQAVHIQPLLDLSLRIQRLKHSLTDPGTHVLRYCPGQALYQAPAPTSGGTAAIHQRQCTEPAVSHTLLPAGQAPEGRACPPVGFHTIRPCVLGSWTPCIPGRSGTLSPDELTCSPHCPGLSSSPALSLGPGSDTAEGGGIRGPLPRTLLLRPVHSRLSTRESKSVKRGL